MVDSRERYSEDDGDYARRRRRRHEESRDEDDDDDHRPVRRLKKFSDQDSNMQPVDWVLAILCSGIGCILGIVYLVQGKPKAGMMIGISLLFVVIWNIVRFVITLAANPQAFQ
jgi:hypothetical protein